MRLPIAIGYYITFVLATIPTLTQAWGKKGHEIVGNVAWSLLNASTQSAILEILPPQNNHTDCQEYCSPLAQVADWADQVRYTSYYHWTAPLHFIDIRDDLIVPGHCHANATSGCHFVYDRDCHDDMCVAGAVVNYTQRLLHHTAAQESLKFLVHFVGDIHQPLHCSRTSDKGGNTIHVTYLNKTAATSVQRLRRTTQQQQHHHGLNLHAVWDDSIIETALLKNHKHSRNNFETSLMTLIEQARNNKAEWDALWNKCPDGASKECTSMWAEESIADALKFAYANIEGNDIESGDHLSYEYYLSRLPVVRQRLALASVRLAVTLEDALAK